MSGERPRDVATYLRYYMMLGHLLQRGVAFGTAAEVAEAINASSNIANIRKLLDNLAEEGWAEVVTSSVKRIQQPNAYRLTPLGRREVEKILIELDRVVAYICGRGSLPA